MKKLFVIAGSLVVVGALAVAGIAYAQTPEPPAAQDGSGGPFGGWRQGPFDADGPHAEIHAAVQAALAEALGLTPEELQTRLADGERLPDIAEAEGLTQDELAQVMIDAKEAAINDAVAQGLITQEQADQMLERGFGPGMGGPHGGPGGFGGADSPVRDLVLDEVADGLGLTREELDSRLADGERLPDIAEAEGLTQDEFAQVMTGAHEAAINEAVAQGLITQEQADQMLERGFGPGMCGPHGPGGRHFGPGGGNGGFGPGGPNGSQTPEPALETGLDA